MKKIIVIGAGAAGMMAAIAAAGTGAKVILLEKNEKLGKKLFITGKGRCNVTNAGEKEAFFANVVSNPKFLYSSFYQFDQEAIMKFLEDRGCRLKVERGDRVFPVSDHSSDVIAAFARELQRQGVEVRFHTEVEELLLQEKIDTDEEKNILQVCGVSLKSGEVLHGDGVIVATGGCSYQLTGSTGDGYRFASETGHRLVETVPSLVPLTAAEKWCGELMGLSLRNVAVKLVMDSKTIYEGFGEMLFTHFGVSGPLILSASSYYGKEQRKWLSKSQKAARAQAVKLPGCQLLLDLKPALSVEQLDKRVLRDFEESKNKHFKNALNGLFPAKMIPVMIVLSGIDPEKPVNEITREERADFVRLIKNIPLTITGTRGFEEAIITKGGVDVRDVNPSTMESKLVKNLYFAGEVLDLDALTGGFNLQIAWSTGHLAGESAGRG